MNLRWRNNSRLANSETHHKSSCKHLSIVPSSGYVNDNTDDPDDTELTSGPDTSYQLMLGKAL